MGKDVDLVLADIDPYLPAIDLHGCIRDAVPYEVDMLIAKHPNTCVRIVYGHGTGVIKNAVSEFLTEKKRQKQIVDFAHELSGASCVVKTR